MSDDKVRFFVSVASIFVSLFVTANAAPVQLEGTNYYKLIVNFKKPISREDRDMTVKTMSIMASKPIILNDRTVTLKSPVFPTPACAQVDIEIVGPALTESEVNSTEKFASSMVDSYLTKHGNGADSTRIYNQTDRQSQTAQTAQTDYFTLWTVTESSKGYSK